ncbi:MAG: hypothetical protein R2729_16495 [Bryobacteraceae bacterium]
MKSNNRGSREPQSAQHVRKTHQYCRQVERALNMALAGTGEGLGEVFVEEVLPAPDCGRLLAYVALPERLGVADAMDWLSRNAPRLRSEVAVAISRKRAPEIRFVPVPWGSGDE